LDANVKRVLARLFAVEGVLQDKKVNDCLWQLSAELLPTQSNDMPVYTQALMDFGATWCNAHKPVCLGDERKCPFEKECQANLSNQVLELPKRVVKAKSPEFECDMLLIRSGNVILLQKRPSKAIWGGLWSLPESNWIARSAVRKKSPTLSSLFKTILPDEKVSVWQKNCQLAKQGPQIKHVFSHRRLWMQIWNINASKCVEPIGANTQWAPLTQIGRYGLPQPIKVLLQGLNLVHGDGLEN
jgi:A/G-specific adenine glycosylase